jgi:NAD+ synthase (glutamine-hydrolysing)
MKENHSFFNLYSHNFVRVAVAIPKVRVADPVFNAVQTIALMREAVGRSALAVVFPELGLSAYSCEDLFQQQALLDGSLVALQDVVQASRQVPVIAVVGLPLQVEGLLFNCAAVIYGGRLLGIAPKTYLPNYREFYELRQFTPGDCLQRDSVDLLGERGIPFGTTLLFEVQDQPLCVFHVEICEDLWVPIAPSSFAALAGATVLINLSASNVTVAKESYRRQLVASQSARCLAAYVYSAAGTGESTTDLAWDGQGMIYENGNELAAARRFLDGPQLIIGDVDLDRLLQERMRQTSFGQAVHRHRSDLTGFRRIRVPAQLSRDRMLPLDRVYGRFPYVPTAVGERDERCREIFDIQVQGLVTRLRAAGIDKVVIGVSGGLDSTQALLVCVRAMSVMGLPRDHILACIMPGFATSGRTLQQARQLAAALRCRAFEIDIRPSCQQMLKDIDHPFAKGRAVYDITFENVQAGDRTSHLFRIANLHRGIVVGTSDLSELALGWCTYGVGDHMAHYDVNASVPKTLIQYLIRWSAKAGALSPSASAVLKEVLDTRISPELVPGDLAGQPAQRSEDIVGPYELQDFHLYYVLRFGYRPTKVAFLAWSAWHDRATGTWPQIPDAERRQYGIQEIKRWLGVFLLRFFKEMQFKRSCLPNAPKVGSGGSLSPRGDYRAPSDAEATVWLSDLGLVPDDDVPTPTSEPRE